MKQEDIFKKIDNILGDLYEQYRFIKNTKEEINDLELELFAANTHFLAENIEVLRKHNKQKAVPPMPEEAPPFTEKFFEPVVQPAQIFWPEKKGPSAKVDEPAEPETKEEEVALPEEEPIIIRHELDISDIDVSEEDDEDIAYVDDEPVLEEVAEIIIPDEPLAEAPVVAIVEAKPEPEKKPVSTINQIIAAQLASTRMADAFSLPPIKDLKSAINLNDKLLYVKDLFNGYSMAYSEAIDILNRFNKFEEADIFLKNNYVKKNNWDGKLATADKFYALLKRRYPD